MNQHYGFILKHDSTILFHVFFSSFLLFSAFHLSLSFLLTFLIFPFSPLEQTRLEELHRLWDLLLQRTKEKGMRLLQAQKLVQYLRECEDALDWISDKVRFTILTQCFICLKASHSSKTPQTP